MAITIRRSLLIGLGGTGVRALQYIKGEFKNHFGFLPLGVRLLAIDTDEQKDVSGVDRPIAELDKGEFMHIRVRGVRDFVRAPEVASWVLPDEKLSFHDITRGAGQRRVSGRIAFFSRASDIRQRLGAAEVDLLGIGEERAMTETGLQLASIGDTNEAELEVYVICSLAGGTGSGMFLDVGYMLREMLGLEKHRIIGVFLLPEVFSRSVDASDNVEGNGYAALKELDYWLSAEEEVTVEYPRGVKAQWGGAAYRKPFDLIYLLDDNNEAGYRVRDLDTLQGFCARSVFLHMTIESQSVESFWRNLKDILENEPGWKGKRPHYMSLGMSTLEVPIARSVDLVIASKGVEIIDLLSPQTKEQEPSLPFESLQKHSQEIIAETRLALDPVLARLGNAIEIDIPEHGFEQVHRETAGTFSKWIDNAERKIRLDVKEKFVSSSKQFAEEVKGICDGLRQELSKILSRQGLPITKEVARTLSFEIDLFVQKLRSEATSSTAELRGPDVDSAFRGVFVANKTRRLEKESFDYLEAVREREIAVAKAGLAQELYTRVRGLLKDLQDEELAAFARVLINAKAVLVRDLTKLQLGAVREAFTEDLGTDLLGINLKSIRDLLDVDYLMEQWQDTSWARLQGMEGRPAVGVLQWMEVPPEELAEWMKRAMRSRFHSVLGESVDERLSALWSTEPSRGQLRKKIDNFIALASPLWRASPPHDREIRYLMLFGIAERTDGSPGFLRRVLEDRDSGISLLTIEGRQMPAPVFANTWERYNFRAIRIAVPAAAYALEHVLGYRSKYMAKEALENSRFSHHIHRDWAGLDGLPDLFPEE